MSFLTRFVTAAPALRLIDRSDRELQRMGLSRDALLHNTFAGLRYS